MTGFHQGILKLAMEPSLLGIALMEGGPDRKIKLDRSPEVDEVIFLFCLWWDFIVEVSLLFSQNSDPKS